MNCPQCYGKGWNQSTREWQPYRAECTMCGGSGVLKRDDVVSQTSFETGGRNALNLQMLEQVRDTLKLMHKASLENGNTAKSADICNRSYVAFRDTLELVNTSLQSAQAASDGKEQGTSNVTHDRPIVKEESQCHTDETKQRDERRDANTPVKYESAPAERSVEGMATETISRDARPGSSGSASEFCPEIADSSNGMGVSSPESSSSSATVRGLMEEAYGAWREADNLIIVKLPGLEEFRISNEGAERLHADFAKICRAPSGIEGQPAKRWWTETRSGSVFIYFGDRGNSLEMAIKYAGVLQSITTAHNLQMPSPPLPGNGEAVHEAAKAIFKYLNEPGRANFLVREMAAIISKSLSLSSPKDTGESKESGGQS